LTTLANAAASTAYNRARRVMAKRPSVDSATYAFRWNYDTNAKLLSAHPGL
jgi:hypothetical protein